jgi:hypothetical protein
VKWLGFTLVLLGGIIAFVCGLELLVLAFKQPALHNALLGIACGTFAAQGGFALMGRSKPDPKVPEAS